MIRLMIALPLLLLVSPLRAHSWYDPACCFESDCAEATQIQATRDGTLVVTTKIGTAVYPPGFEKIKENNHDNRVHACMSISPIPGSNFHTPFCLYIPDSQ